MNSPKQPSSSRQRDWYPYYAGFTEAFVESVLDDYLGDSREILDPWNGSGTTTAVCLKRGLHSSGVDLNPVLTVIARARLTPVSVRDSLVPLALQILKEATSRLGPSNPRDLLRLWMTPEAISGIRAIQDAILLVLADTEMLAGDQELAAHADQLPVLACFYYTALFAAVRDLLAPFQSSNPTWLKAAESEQHKITPSWSTLSPAFLERVVLLSDRLSLDCDNCDAGLTSFHTASAASLPFEDGQYDAALTSPPYATRIDYVKATLPELAVFGASDSFVSVLREQTTGTPVVKGYLENASPAITSDYALDVLHAIGKHPSKGSKSYYAPCIHKYLVSLQSGLSETARVVNGRGAICIVVQDSYYKEFRIDLQRIVIELMHSFGRVCVRRFDYPVNALRSRQNPKAKRHVANRTNTESLLVFN